MKLKWIQNGEAWKAHKWNIHPLQGIGLGTCGVDGEGFDRTAISGSVDYVKSLCQSMFDKEVEKRRFELFKVAFMNDDMDTALDRVDEYLKHYYKDVIE